MIPLAAKSPTSSPPLIPLGLVALKGWPLSKSRDETIGNHPPASCSLPTTEAKENILWGAVRARASPTQPTDDLIMARRRQNILGVRKSPHKCRETQECSVGRPQQVTDHCAPINGRNATMGDPRVGFRGHQVCTGTQTWIQVHN